MGVWFLLVGVAIGLAVAAPIGPVNVICIQRAMRGGAFGAFVVGLGAAFGDAIFGAVAAFGLTTVSSFLFSIERALGVVGGIVLIAMGIFAWRSRPHLSAPEPTPRDFAHGAAATFVLTITNPITALGFVAFFTSVGFTRTSSRADAATIVLGVFLGSALWWFLISRIAQSVRGRLSDRHLLLINRGSAVVIWLFGGAALVKGLWG